jgi:hypothetical protein
MSDAMLVRNYILDRLSKEDRDECERRFLFDPNFESLMLQEEQDLLDDYVSLRLGEEEAGAIRGRAEQHPEFRLRLLLADGLRRATATA